MDKQVVDVDQSDDLVDVHFQDGDSVKSDLHVVAEGYQSNTRQLLLPEVPVEYAGYVGWRALQPARDIPGEIRQHFINHLVYFHGPDYQIQAYPVPSPDGSTKPLDRRINFLWYEKAQGEHLDKILQDKSGNQREGSVPPGQLRDDVWKDRIEAAKRSEIPDIFVELARTYDEPFVQCIFDVATTKMVVDRVCFVGDAAFFIRPHMAAGTNHAASDAFSLAETLSSYDDLKHSLSLWEQEQLELGHYLVEKAKARGNRYMQIE